MPRFLALEWDAREARIAVARTRGSEMVVEHAFCVDLELRDGQTPAESEVGKRVAAALAARSLGRTETLVAVGRASIELRQLSLPPSPADELPELVRFQALRQFTTINDEWPIDFVPVDAGESESLHVIAAAIAPELVSQIQATCESAELSAKRLILRPFAAASLWHRFDQDRQPPCTLMLDLLAEEADLTVMVDGQVAMMRTVRLSSGQNAEAQSRALLGEIRRTIAAAQNQLSGHRVKRIVMCGDGGEQATLKKLVEDQLSYQVELFDPFGQLQLEGDLAQSKPAYPGRFAPLLGILADEAAGSGHAIDFLHPRKKPAPPNPWRSNGLYIGLGAAVCATLVLLMLMNRANLDSRIAELEIESRGLDKTVEKARKKTDDVNRVEDFLRTDYTWLDEIKQLADTLPPAEDVIFTQVNMIAATNGGQISLDGYTRESSHIEDVQAALRKGGRRVLSKGGQVDERRNDYKWQFKEVVVLEPRSDVTINASAAAPATPEIPSSSASTEASEPAAELEDADADADAAQPEGPAAQQTVPPAEAPSTDNGPVTDNGPLAEGAPLTEGAPAAASEPAATSEPAAENTPAIDAPVTPAVAAPTTDPAPSVSP